MLSIWIPDWLYQGSKTESLGYLPQILHTILWIQQVIIKVLVLSKQWPLGHMQKKAIPRSFYLSILMSFPRSSGKWWAQTVIIVKIYRSDLNMDNKNKPEKIFHLWVLAKCLPHLKAILFYCFALWNILLQHITSKSKSDL